MANEVKSSVNITIGANADALNKAFDEAQARANSFSNKLAKAAALGATAFITLRDGVIGTVEAFAESEAASKRLDAALLNQGLLTTELREKYSSLTDELSLLTGQDDDAIKGMLATAQGMMGAQQITSEMVKAVADLSAGMGIDLADAFEKVAKTVGTGTNALGRQGFALDATMTKTERMASIIQQIEQRYDGQARASQTVGTAISNLGVQFGNLREEMGRRFAPIVETLTKGLTSLVTVVLRNPAIIDFAANVALAAAAVLGLVSGVLAVKAAIALLAPVFAVIVSPLGLWVAGIAAVIGAGYLLIKHLDDIKAAWVGFSKNISTLGEGLVELLKGVFTLDTEAFKSGLDQLKAYWKQSLEDMRKEQPPELPKLTESEALAAQNAENAKIRAKEEADRESHRLRLQEIEKNKTEAIILQTQVGTKDLVDLKNQENSLLEQLDKEFGDSEVGRNSERIAAIKEQIALNHEEQYLAEVAHKDRMAELDAVYAQTKLDAQAMGFQTELDLTQQQQNQLFAMALSEKEAKQQVNFDLVKANIDRNNAFLKDQARYGETYAKVNRALHSQEIGLATESANQLVELGASKNKTLQAIGRAAAVTQIGIDTAQGAASIFARLNALLPLLAPAIGAAGAAAIVAFGAEKTRAVLQANTGGIVPGYGPNMDSVPAMLTPGELVVPRNNFDEVVGAVRSDRAGGSGEVVAQLQALRGDLQGARPNVVVNGDVLTDDSFIDRMIQKISDRLEFGNARLVGVNA